MFHRVPCPLDGVPHLDMLHAARRLWRQRPLTTGTPDPDDSSCSLAVLEKHIAGLHRVGDVPGYEIPSRFFRFVRDGDARPLEAVLEHNRLDLISLAAVLARAITLVTRGPGEARTAQEAYGLARVYERAGAYDNAEASLLKTIDFARRVGAEPEVHAEALAPPGVDSPAGPPRARGRRRLARAGRRCRAARPRSAARRRKRSRFITSTARRTCRRPASTRSSCCRTSTPTTVRVRHRLDRLERKIARYTATLPLRV